MSLSGFDFQPLLLVMLLSARLKSLLRTQHFLLIKVPVKFTHLVTSLRNKARQNGVVEVSHWKMYVTALQSCFATLSALLQYHS